MSDSMQWLVAFGDIKWTDKATAIGTLLQALVVAIGIVVALRQLDQARQSDISKNTDEIYDRLSREDVDQAIGRISQHYNPEDDWDRIQVLLQKIENHAERLQCESDIIKLTNVFERIYDKFNNNLLDKERFLESHDEITLFICLSLLKAHQVYDYPDYGPLFKLARRCRDNYVLAGGQNEYLLRIRIPEKDPKRFNTLKHS